MRDEVIAKNALGAVEGAKIAPPVFKNKTGTTTALGEKIQFSSIFKASIDSPEKTLTNAQKPKDTLEDRPDNMQSDIDSMLSRDEYSSSFNDRNSLDENVNVKNKSQLEGRDDPITISENTSASNPHEVNSSQSKNNISDDIDNFSINNFLAENDKNFRESSPPSRQEVLNSTITSNPAVMQKPINQNITVPGPETHNPNQINKNKIVQANNNAQLISKVSPEITAPIIRDMGLNKFDEKIRFKSVQNLRSPVTAGNTYQNSNNLVNIQEQDLSNRLKADPFTPIKIQVNNSKNPINSNFSVTKAPIAQFAELSLNETMSLSKSGVLKFAPSMETKNLNPQQNNITNQSTPSVQTDVATNMGPTLRQQAAMVGAHQSITNQSIMAPKVSVGSEIPNLTGSASTSSSSPSQQTSRVAPPPPPPPTKPPLPVEQVALQIKKAIGAGIDKINIKLSPAHLGKVEVRMEIARDGQLTATILADRPETLELLQRDIRGLERALQDGGLKTDSQSFNFSLKEQAQQQIADRNKNKDTQNNNNQENRESNSDENQELSNGVYEGSYGSNLANNGGIDIRI